MAKKVGIVSKMKAKADEPVTYILPLGEFEKELNPHIGKTFGLKHTGHIQCIYCERKIKKTYSQGYCYPCSQKLARCDYCILKPERCHYHLGTCREPEWGEANCMIPHYVYLSVTSDIKIGITRHTQIPTRWIDQGATQAMPLFKVMTRQQSGYLEEVFKELLNDKTNWRTLLKQDNPVMDLDKLSAEFIKKAKKGIDSVKMTFGEDAIKVIEDRETYTFTYPVNEYPEKIKSISFDKMPDVEGTLLGIKGQYLIFDIGVLNIRKHTGYELECRV